MQWWIPLFLLFGFFAGRAPHDQSFAILLPLLACAALVPAMAELVVQREHRLLIVSTVLAATFVASMNVTFAALTLAVATAVSVTATRFHESVGKQLLTSGLTALLLALVIEPAGLALGLWHYADPGLYYDLPPVVMLTWFCAGAVGGVVAQRMRDIAQPVSLDMVRSTIVVLAFMTGVCTSFGLWPAALLGLLLLQFSFHVVHYW